MKNSQVALLGGLAVIGFVMLKNSGTAQAGSTAQQQTGYGGYGYQPTSYAQNGSGSGLLQEIGSLFSGPNGGAGLPSTGQGTLINQAGQYAGLLGASYNYSGGYGGYAGSYSA